MSTDIIMQVNTKSVSDSVSSFNAASDGCENRKSCIALVSPDPNKDVFMFCSTLLCFRSTMNFETRVILAAKQNSVCVCVCYVSLGVFDVSVFWKKFGGSALMLEGDCCTCCCTSMVK